MIRKAIASGLMVAANAVAKDQTPERIQKWVHDSRIKIAKVIEPN
jgi:CO dehydrogenase/acetyl-CoA synthase epsilon subunit